MNTTLASLVKSLPYKNIEEGRKKELQDFVDYLQEKKAKNLPLHLNFICTHNSRRSQFSQLWAKAMAHYHGHECTTYSGGVEVTACNERVIQTLIGQGFSIEQEGVSQNPHYRIQLGGVSLGTFFSKLFDDPSSPTTGFAAIMTCAHADENCPFIPGAEQRIPVRYKDPKAFDDTPKEAEAYLAKSIEIATEMHYVFSCL
ncbi:protein-tyrosine-phosphatase [Flavobacteriaceae bacterium]|jgi:arsenate reductase|nr:protein-tyrosine-phosphatase [Flavobacteriaceae bacterium]